MYKIILTAPCSGLVDKRVSYGAMGPGFNTPVGRELFRICEDWIGVLCLGVCSMVCLGDGFCNFFIEIQIKLISRDATSNSLE